MVRENSTICPKCRGELIFYDHVSRLVRTKFRATKQIRIRRLRCNVCFSSHRELPNFVLPFKQYEADVIFRVLDGIITADTLDFEDYPCEQTMKRWRKSFRTHFLQ